MKRIISLILASALLVSAFCVNMVAASAPDFTKSSTFTLSGSGFNAGDDAAHGNHQTRTVHTSHGDYAAYITGTYTDEEHQTVNKWSLIKIDPATKSKKVIFTGEKYFDSSQVSLLVDKEENVWAITSTSDSLRYFTTEGLDCRAHKLDAKTGEVTSYTSRIITGGAKDGYGYASCFYDQYKDRIIVMHAGGDYKEGSTTGASFNWTIFDLKTNTWQARVRSVKIPARHCYMYGHMDENGGLTLVAERDIKAESLGYPEVGNNKGLNYAEQQYMQQNGITRWAANYCWDQLDFYYFPNITSSTVYTYSICEADYSRVLGTQDERYTLEKRLSNFYPVVQNNNGGDVLVTTDENGRRLLHVTYCEGFIQAAMDRQICSDATWYYQVWDITDGTNAQMLHNEPIPVEGGIADEIARNSGFSFRLYEDTNKNMYLISGQNGTVHIYRAYEYGKTFKIEKFGTTKTLVGSGSLINISNQRSNSLTDNKINILLMNSGKYTFTQLTLDAVEYEKPQCSHKYALSANDSYSATCTENGKSVYVCSECLETKEESLPALGHSITKTTVSATCTANGSITEKCSRCSYTAITEILAMGHDTVSTVIEPTCTAKGYKTTTCNNCNYGVVTVLEKTDHSFSGGVCTVCGKSESDIEFTPGDINNDGKTNGLDVNTFKRILSGALEPTTTAKLAGDLNGDGILNSLDANILSKKVAGT